MCCPLCLPQLAAHIAGQVFVGGHIMGCAVLSQLSRHTEDHALQLGGQFLRGFSSQLRHICHIHTGFFRDGDSQGFAGGIHRSYRLMGLDGPFGEHIRLALQPAVLVNDFQGAEQIVGRIIRKGQPVGPVIDETVLSREIVIEPI